MDMLKNLKKFLLVGLRSRRNSFPKKTQTNQMEISTKRSFFSNNVSHTIAVSFVIFFLSKIYLHVDLTTNRIYVRNISAKDVNDNGNVALIRQPLGVEWRENDKIRFLDGILITLFIFHVLIFLQLFAVSSTNATRTCLGHRLCNNLSRNRRENALHLPV